jgi:hypothetical protein
MKKLLTITILVGTLSLGFPNPAFAKDKTLTIPKVATITYPAVVKLVDSGCQRIKFKYTAPRVDRTYGLLSVILKDADDYEIGGAVLSKSTKDIGKYPQLLPLGKKGTINITVCREPWNAGFDVQTSEAWPGMVEVGFSAIPQGFPDITPRVYGTIKFTGKFVGNALDDLLNNLKP